MLVLDMSIHEEIYTFSTMSNITHGFMEKYSEISQTKFKRIDDKRYTVIGCVGPENLRDVIVLLTDTDRKAMMGIWEVNLYPITSEDELKQRSLVALFKWKNSRFAFLDLDGKRYVLKRFISYWEFMKDYTPRFEPDGFFCKINSSYCTPEQIDLLKELVDESKSVDELIGEISKLSPEELAEKYSNGEIIHNTL